MRSHITFDPSIVIHRPALQSKNGAVLTAKEFLQPNFFIYKPMISKMSPYDINESPIPFDNGSNSCGKKDSNQIGIENYDPKIPAEFTEKLTLEAIENLSIQPSDLFFPTYETLEKINERDKKYYENLLIERALRYREEVRIERNKILDAQKNNNLNMKKAKMVNQLNKIHKITQNNPRSALNASMRTPSSRPSETIGKNRTLLFNKKEENLRKALDELRSNRDSSSSALQLRKSAIQSPVGSRLFNKSLNTMSSKSTEIVSPSKNNDNFKDESKFNSD